MRNQREKKSKQVKKATTRNNNDFDFLIIWYMINSLKILSTNFSNSYPFAVQLDNQFDWNNTNANAY
jgi:hypothetical protein